MERKVQKRVAQHLAGQPNPVLLQELDCTGAEMSPRTVAHDRKSLRINAVFFCMIGKVANRIPDFILGIGERLHIRLYIVDIDHQSPQTVCHLLALGVQQQGVTAHPCSAVDIEYHGQVLSATDRAVQIGHDRLCVFPRHQELLTLHMAEALHTPDRLPAPFFCGKF